MNNEWYEVEYAINDSDDWFACAYKSDTLDGIKAKFKRHKGELNMVDFRFRAVKKTLSSEVVEGIK